MAGSALAELISRDERLFAFTVRPFWMEALALYFIGRNNCAVVRKRSVVDLATLCDLTSFSRQELQRAADELCGVGLWKRAGIDRWVIVAPRSLGTSAHTTVKAN